MSVAALGIDPRGLSRPRCHSSGSPERHRVVGLVKKHSLRDRAKLGQFHVSSSGISRILELKGRFTLGRLTMIVDALIAVRPIIALVMDLEPSAEK
jgi:hypothetical protein